MSVGHKMHGKGCGSMEKAAQESRLAIVCSTIYLLVSIGVLALVCSICCPQIGEKIREVMTGWDSNPVKTVFHTFADHLEEGQPLREAFSQTMEGVFP